MMGLRSVAEEHRVVATEILIRRARGDWGLDADRAAVVGERLLWAQMTEEEQAADDLWLAGIWVGRGVVRELSGVVIPDSAFGLAGDGYRPWVKGPYGDVGVLAAVWKWLWIRGYQVVRHQGDTVTMVIPPHRLVQESERLIAAMVKAGVPSGLIRPLGPSGGIHIRSSYDPVQGLGTMELIGLGHLAKALGS